VFILEQAVDLEEVADDVDAGIYSLPGMFIDGVVDMHRKLDEKTTRFWPRTRTRASGPRV